MCELFTIRFRSIGLVEKTEAITNYLQQETGNGSIILCTYQCKPRGGGGGGAGKGWGFDQGAKILVNFPRVGQHMFIKCSQNPHPGAKYQIKDKLCTYL